MFVKAPRGISDQDYCAFVDFNDCVLQPLDVAHSKIEEALAWLMEDSVDNTTQKEYARTQVNSMRYLLGRIMNKLEGQ